MIIMGTLMILMDGDFLGGKDGTDVSRETMGGNS